MKGMLLLSAILISVQTMADDVHQYYAPSSSCRSLQRAIEKEGQAVIFTAPEIYDMVVRDNSFCWTPEYAKCTAFVKTKDVERCNIGFRCRSASKDCNP